MRKEYVDVTRKWIKKTSQRTGSVKDMNYWIIDGKVYLVDGKNVVLDYSGEEKKVALWLVETFGGEIFMCPRVNIPENVKTPDYIYNNEKWDLKTIVGSSSRAIDNSIKGKFLQASNFVIDISKSNLKPKEVIMQAKQIYVFKSRRWVNKIVIKKNDKAVLVLERKRD